MLTPREAARLIGVSYPSIKQWILTGESKTVQIPGGHRRIIQSTLKPSLEKDKAKSSARIARAIPPGQRPQPTRR